jgi:TRAP-type C4-dicarboxylate transport system permease small subunit
MSASATSLSLRRLDTALGRVERHLTATLLAAILLLGGLQMGLRQLFATGVGAFDQLARGGLLWLTMLGAAHAAQRGLHLAIDALPTLLSRRLRAGVARVAALTTTAVAATLTVAGLRFAAAELAFTGAAGVATATAIPVGFSLIMLHSAAAAFTPRLPPSRGP